MRGVQAIAFAMEYPVGAPRLEIRSLRVASESPGDALLDAGPVVGEFGQWIRDTRPGKARDLDATNITIPPKIPEINISSVMRTQCRKTQTTANPSDHALWGSV